MMHERGFTLIETIIYIGLFGIMIGGVVGAAYNLAQSAHSLGANVAVHDEGNFVLRKIAWAMAGASSISGSNADCESPTPLIIGRYDGTTVFFRRNSESGAIEMKENAGEYVPITSSYHSGTCLMFQLIRASGGAPAGVEATTTIKGMDFAITKYLRL